MARNQQDELSRIISKGYWREAEAREVLFAQQASGLSLATYSRRHGIRDGRLRYWRSRLRGGTGTKAAGQVIPFFRVELKDSKESKLVSACEQDSGVEVLLTSGHRVKLNRGFDSETLIRILDLVGERGC